MCALVGPLRVHRAPVCALEGPLRVHRAPVCAFEGSLRVHRVPVCALSGPLCVHGAPVCAIKSSYQNLNFSITCSGYKNGKGDKPCGTCGLKMHRNQFHRTHKVGNACLAKWLKSLPKEDLAQLPVPGDWEKKLVPAPQKNGEKSEATNVNIESSI